MIRSMTGYGRFEAVLNNRNIGVEVKSVNHRYADYTIRTPRSFGFLEDKVREFLQNTVSRGKLDLFISLDTTQDDNKCVTLNKQLAEGYILAVRELSSTFGLEDDLTASKVARFNDIFSIERKEEDQDTLWLDVKSVLQQAMCDFIASREREGTRLKEDLLERGKVILENLTEIEGRAPEVSSEYRVKIETRIKDLLQDVPVDENRLLTEVAIFTDKISIAEETVRLKSHFEEMSTILASDQPVGRKLDFLIQEMNREINTIGSKANDLFISKRVVEIKSEIEKLREQVQNIE